MIGLYTDEMFLQYMVSIGFIGAVFGILIEVIDRKTTKWSRLGKPKTKKKYLQVRKSFLE
jgi:hypothetical protein